MDIFDTNMLNSRQEYVVQLWRLMGKAGVKESPFVFSVAHGVIGPASGLSRLEIVVIVFLSRSVFQPPCGWKF